MLGMETIRLHMMSKLALRVLKNHETSCFINKRTSKIRLLHTKWSMIVDAILCGSMHVQPTIAEWAPTQKINMRVGTWTNVTRTSHAKPNTIMGAPESGSLISRCWWVMTVLTWNGSFYKAGVEFLLPSPRFSVDLIIHFPVRSFYNARRAMRAVSVCCASFLSALLLLHYILTPSGVMVSKEKIQSRKLLQSVFVSSEKARRQVFHAAAAANMTAGAQVSENLKKQTPSRSNPIQN